MDPFTGQPYPRLDEWPDRIVWSAFTIGVLGLLLLILLVSVNSLGEPLPTVGAEPVQTAIPVQVEPVESRRDHSRLRLPGVVEPLARIELGFRVGGHIARFRASEGQRVEAGEVIAVLDAVDLDHDAQIARAALRRVHAEARAAENALERQQELLARSSTSQDQLRQAELRAELTSARASEARLVLGAAETRLERASLRAPFEGVIEARLKEAHELTTVQSPVVVLTDLAHIRVRAALPDRLISRLAPGAKAVVRTPAWPGRTFEGRVTQIAVSVDPVTRTVPFEIALANADSALRPELPVEVELELSDADARASVPIAAVLRDADQDPFCFVVTGEAADRHAQRRRLVLGDVIRDRVAILSGVLPGEQVVVRGQHFVHAGASVSVVTTAAGG